MRSALTLAFALGVSVLACLAPAAVAGGKAGGPPIVIEKQGSFTAGGTVIGDSTKSLHCDHGYVDYQIPVHARKTSIFLWHSSSTQVWQQRWDGGDGYQTILLRRGYPVYLWDGPRVGRGNMSCESRTYNPVIGQDQRNFIAWRFGPAPGEWFPDIQFPKDDAEAFDQAMAARYEEFDIAKNAHLEAEAAAKAIDRIGPSVLLTNSAGGWRAMLAALKSDNVKGIVAYETAAFVFPEGEGPQEPEGGFGPTHVSKEEFMRLTRIPIQLVWGDNTEKTTWVKQTALSKQFVDTVNALGGHAEVLMLSSTGLKGNTHIPFADLNNEKVADQLALFLKKNKLDGR
jgi:hypothetical protein